MLKHSQLDNPYKIVKIFSKDTFLKDGFNMKYH